jgi:hypothetical protein
MASYVLNVRIAQFDVQLSALRLPRNSLRSALDAAGHDVLLYASRDEELPGYYGTALLGDPAPDPRNPKVYLLPLLNRQALARIVSLEELRALGVEEQPFHIYAHPIRRVGEETQLALVNEGLILRGFGEEVTEHFLASSVEQSQRNSTDYRALRFEMLDLYGPKCAFLRRSFPSLDGHRYGIDVGHLWPHWAGGPDIIQNVLPMSKGVNNQWDEGLISLTNNGDLLIARQAGQDTRWLFSKCKRIIFPEDVAQWPDAKFLERHRDEIFEKGPNYRR